MTVQEKIKSIVEGMGETYIFDNWQTANIKLDKGVLPCVLNVLPVSGYLNVGLNQLKDKPNCMIAFMDKVELDFDGEQNDDIIERCKNRAKEFILTINRGNVFKPISGDVRYSTFYDKLDVNVTGIVIELQLEELKGNVICSTRTPKEIVYGRSEKDNQ